MLRLLNHGTWSNPTPGQAAVLFKYLVSGLMASIFSVSATAAEAKSAQPITSSSEHVKHPTVSESAANTSSRHVAQQSGVSILDYRQRSVPGPSENELLAELAGAVRAALGRSPNLQRANAEHEAAESDVDEAKGRRWPQVEVGAQTKPTRLGGGEAETSSGGMNLSVTTTVFDWGRTRKTIASREHLAGASAAKVEAERENLAFEVTENTLELAKQRIIIDISQQFVTRMDELVKMLAGIVAVDPGRNSELTQAKARLLQAQSSLDVAKTRAQEAEINLKKLIGERVVNIPFQREWNIQLVDLDTLLAKVDDHPVVRQAKQEVMSSQLNAEVIRSSSRPQVDWVISKSTAEDSLGRSQPLQASLNLRWAAFSGGSNRAAERAALQRAGANQQEVEQQRLDLEYRIRTSNHDARASLERAELYRSLTRESNAIRVAFYDQWYHLAKRTLLDVLIAENDHYSNQTAEITNRFDAYQAVFRQYASAGQLQQWLGVADIPQSNDTTLVY